MTQSRFFSSVAQPNSLQSNITSSAVSIPLAVPPIGYPVNTPFTIALDYGDSVEELCDVTAVAGSVFTVTRAVDGTSAASHNVGAAIRHVSSARDFNEDNAHINSSAGVHGIAPGSSVVGTTDTQTLTNKTLTSPIITGTIPFASLGVTNPVGTSPLTIEAAPSQTAPNLSILDSSGSSVLSVSATGAIAQVNENATDGYSLTSANVGASGFDVFLPTGSTGNAYVSRRAGVTNFKVDPVGGITQAYVGSANAHLIQPTAAAASGVEVDLITTSTGNAFISKLNGSTVFSVAASGATATTGHTNTGNFTNTGTIVSTGDISTTSGNVNAITGAGSFASAQIGNAGITGVGGTAPYNVPLHSLLSSLVSVTSSTTMISSGLSFSFAPLANTAYFVEFFLGYNSGATGKFTTQWSVGGSATITSTARNTMGLDSTVSSTVPSGIMRAGVSAYGTSVTYGDRAGVASLYAYESGVVTVTTAGTCSVILMFAQSVSNATAVNLVAGSYARLTRVS